MKKKEKENYLERCEITYTSTKNKENKKREKRLGKARRKVTKLTEVITDIASMKNQITPPQNINKKYFRSTVRYIAIRTHPST